MMTHLQSVAPSILPVLSVGSHDYLSFAAICNGEQVMLWRNVQPVPSKSGERTPVGEVSSNTQERHNCQAVAAFLEIFQAHGKATHMSPLLGGSSVDGQTRGGIGLLR